MPGPLEGLVVIDAGTRIGAPFCAGLLGEQGAEVIKVERPDGGDYMRLTGPFDGDYSLWWAVEGRGRKSVTCDLGSREGQALFRRLVSSADVLCENFRPGTMESWELGPADLPDSLVYVRISGFGQEGPYHDRPALDRMGIAHGGLLHVTGEAARAPMRPGVTVSDYLTGVFAAEAAMAALYERDARGTGKGKVIDAPLYASVMRIMEWTFAAQHRLGMVRERTGNRLPFAAPMDNYPAADGRWVSIVAGSDENFERLCHAMGRLDLQTDPRFVSAQSRGQHSLDINEIVARWVRDWAATDIEARCLAAGVPVAIALSASDIAWDPHVESRGDLVMVEDPVLGPLRQQAPHPRYVGEPTPVPSGAPTLGQHNDEIWMERVGLTRDEYVEAIDRGTI